MLDLLGFLIVAFAVFCFFTYEDQETREKKAQKRELYEQLRRERHEASQAFYDSPAWINLRREMRKLHGEVCMRCEYKPVNGCDRPNIHVDHIKPKSKFMRQALDPRNMQILCRNCNFEKGSNDYTDYRSAKQKDAAETFAASYSLDESHGNYANQGV